MKRRVINKPWFFINRDLFKRWTPKMAYVLGYFAADGSLYVNPRGSHYIEFSSTDRTLLEKVRQMLESNHSISKRISENPKWKTRYRLQIGSKEIFNDLLKLGFTPSKSNSLKFPEIPDSYLRHFVRGYFDGDGCVDFGFYQKRGQKKPNLLTKFSSGSKNFLKDLLKHLKTYIRIRGGSIYQKQGGSWDLSFGLEDSFKLYKFIYKNVKKNRFLERKYNEFQEAIKYYGGVA